MERLIPFVVARLVDGARADGVVSILMRDGGLLIVMDRAGALPCGRMIRIGRHQPERAL